MKKNLCVFLMALLMLASFCSVYAEDAVILFTNDVHCGYADNLGYSGVAAYKEAVEAKNPNVILVDIGDAIQGDVIGAVSKGEYVIDMMNAAGYKYSAIGNHEFDYGMDRLAELAEKANFVYLASNIYYTGSNENKLEFAYRSAMTEIAGKKVAFIGLSTPNSIATSTPTYFQEDGEFVYDFTPDAKEGADNLFAFVQDLIDSVKEQQQPDYIIALSHLGIEEGDAPYRSIDLIQNTTGIDAVLDGHSHSVIPQQMVANKDGELVALSSTGTKLNFIGQLTITDAGEITTTLVNGSALHSEAYDAAIAPVVAEFEEKVNEVVATSDTALQIKDESGIRMVRSRETNLGDLCADAYRELAGADIALVNGGGVRENLPAGDITFANVIAVHPFGNMLTSVKATGQQVLDALEWTARKTASEYNDGAGNALGENGGFLQVSGLKYTIDTAIESPAVADANGMFVEFTEGGARRVKDVQVLKDGEWVAIDPEAEYIVASHNYLLKDGGDGTTMFQGDEVVLNETMSDYQVLLTYITDVLGGQLSSYANVDNRITVL